MRTDTSSILIGLMLFATATVPSFGYMFFHAPSMSAGVFLISGMYIFLFLAISVVQKQTQNLSVVAIVVTVVLGAIVVHGAVSFLINSNFDNLDFSRFSQSNLLLIIYILGAFSVARMVQGVSNFRADFAIKLTFYALVLTAFAGIMKYSPFTPPDTRKHVLFFNEPSHFALSFLPFFLYMTVTASQKMKLRFVLFGYAMAFLIESMTLVVGVTLAATLGIKARKLLFLMGIAALIVVFTAVNLDYYLDRLHFFADIGDLNMSTMSSLSGWERAYLNLKNTFGLGVGFQQFGIIGKYGDIMEAQIALEGAQNVLDGGAMGPKLIGEFGFLGVTMLLAYLVFFVKSVKHLLEVSKGRLAVRDCRTVFFLSCSVMYSIDLFVRGLSYFTTSGFLLIASLMWMKSRKIWAEHPIGTES